MSKVIKLEKLLHSKDLEKDYSKVKCLDYVPINSVRKSIDNIMNMIDEEFTGEICYPIMADAIVSYYLICIFTNVEIDLEKTDWMTILYHPTCRKLLLDIKSHSLMAHDIYNNFITSVNYKFNKSPLDQLFETINNKIQNTPSLDPQTMAQVMDGLKSLNKINNDVRTKVVEEYVEKNSDPQDKSDKKLN